MAPYSSCMSSTRLLLSVEICPARLRYSAVQYSAVHQRPEPAGDQLREAAVEGEVGRSHSPDHQHVVLPRCLQKIKQSF